MKDLIRIILLVLLLNSCDLSNNKRILYNGELVEGAIIKNEDTILNGQISFYDTSNQQLLRIEDYTNDTLNGNSVYYFENGKIAIKTHYFYGKENGYELTFDTLGQLSQKKYYFHGVQFGPTVTYSDNRLDVYSFYSFDGAQLIHLEYDSLINKQESWWHQDFFFSNKSYLQKYMETHELSQTYFIYLPSPPAYDFKYSLCKSDSVNMNIETIKIFNSNKVYDTFEIPVKEGFKNKHYKLKLEIIRHDKVIWTDFKQLD